MGRVWSRFGCGSLQDISAISPPVGCVRRGGPWLRYCTLRCAACPLEFSPSLIYVLLFRRGVEEVARHRCRTPNTPLRDLERGFELINQHESKRFGRSKDLRQNTSVSNTHFSWRQ